MLLRSDVSAIDAMVNGAFAAAVGTASSMRHLYPVSNRFAGTPSPSVFVPALLNFHIREKIEDGIVALPDLDVWRCHCGVCGGGRLDWIFSSAEDKRNAYRHSVSALAKTWKEIRGAGSDQATWKASWREMRRNALWHYDHLAAELKSQGKTPWTAASFLRA
jgi:hypothetical protein